MPAAFRCPHCSACSLKITGHLEMPPDSDWDEITLQTVGCASCGQGALAVYKESRRGAQDSEIWRHTGYQVDVLDLQRITETISRCPSPQNSSCLCSAHLELGRTNASLQWDGISQIAVLESFQMDICK